jgi:hypothetical protein
LQRECCRKVTPRRYDPRGSLSDPGDFMTMLISKKSEQSLSKDVGTLWTMGRLGCQARCALIARPADWELRVLIDGQILLTQRCTRGAEAFRLAEQWRGRMLDDGWIQVVPRSSRSRHS